jgi:uncharacterized Fe-S cluster-containing radical SAM superfamily protein
MQAFTTQEYMLNADASVVEKFTKNGKMEIRSYLKGGNEMSTKLIT